MSTDNPMGPFEDLFKQIADILKLVKEGVAKPADDASDLPPGIADKLAKLRHNVDKFKKMGDEFVDEWNQSKAALKSKLPLGELTISKEDKRLIDQANKLKAQVEEASKNFASEATKAQEESGVSLPPETDAKYGKKRRKKFKRFGGDGKWRPL